MKDSISEGRSLTKLHSEDPVGRQKGRKDRGVLPGAHSENHRS